MWQNLLEHCAVLTKVSEEFAPHYLAEIRHDMRQTTTIHSMELPALQELVKIKHRIDIVGVVLVE